MDDEQKKLNRLKAKFPNFEKLQSIQPEVYHVEAVVTASAFNTELRHGAKMIVKINPSGLPEVIKDRGRWNEVLKDRLGVIRDAFGHARAEAEAKPNDFIRIPAQMVLEAYDLLHSFQCFVEKGAYVIPMSMIDYEELELRTKVSADMVVTMMKNPNDAEDDLELHMVKTRQTSRNVLFRRPKCEPIPFDSSRAKEIWAKRGPQHSMAHVMTPGEVEYVFLVWDALPGNTSWMDAFFRIKHNTVNAVQIVHGEWTVAVQMAVPCPTCLETFPVEKLRWTDDDKPVCVDCDPRGK